MSSLSGVRLRLLRAGLGGALSWDLGGCGGTADSGSTLGEGEGQGGNGGCIKMAPISILPGFDCPSAFHTTAACYREDVILATTRDLLDR